MKRLVALALLIASLAFGSGVAVGSSVFPFTDVPADYWARADIEAVYEAGITRGCGPDTFCPERAITRAEMAVMLRRALSLP